MCSKPSGCWQSRRRWPWFGVWRGAGTQSVGLRIADGCPAVSGPVLRAPRLGTRSSVVLPHASDHCPASIAILLGAADPQCRKPFATQISGGICHLFRPRRPAGEARFCPRVGSSHRRGLPPMRTGPPRLCQFTEGPSQLDTRPQQFSSGPAINDCVAYTGRVGCAPSSHPPGANNHGEGGRR
jgi:hypothetical protein